MREQNKSHTQNPTATIQSLLVLLYSCHSCYGISLKQKYPFVDRFSFDIVLCYISEDSWVPQCQSTRSTLVGLQFQIQTRSDQLCMYKSTWLSQHWIKLETTHPENIFSTTKFSAFRTSYEDNSTNVPSIFRSWKETFSLRFPSGVSSQARRTEQKDCFLKKNTKQLKVIRVSFLDVRTCAAFASRSSRHNSHYRLITG